MVALAFLAIVALFGAAPVDAGDETCYPVAVGPDTPSGIAGCTLDGPTAGVASWHPGHVAAANWCTWPFTGCGWVRVTSHATGIRILAPVAMYCDCWWTSDRRLVDLSLGQVRALGLDPADGTYAVTVEPMADQPEDPAGDESVAGGAIRADAPSAAVLPDTAAAP